MRHALRIQEWLAVVAAITTMTAVLEATSPIPPPVRMPDLTHVWIGFSCDRDQFDIARLELRPDGTGILLMQYSPDDGYNPPQTFQITKTLLDQWDVAMEMRAIGSTKDQSVSSIRGTYSHARKRLHLRINPPIVPRPFGSSPGLPGNGVMVSFDRSDILLAKIVQIDRRATEVHTKR